MGDNHDGFARKRRRVARTWTGLREKWGGGRIVNNGGEKSTAMSNRDRREESRG